MPTKTYKTLEEAYQGLTDLEILDDEFNYPVAKIKVPGMHEIKITMVSEWDFYYVLNPMREKFLNYCLNRFSQSEGSDDKKILEQIKTLVNDIESCNTKEDIQKKSTAIQYLLEDIKIRYEFYKSLKKMGVIKWWVSFSRYQKCMRPIDSITIFTYLWLFNFDGVKKNAILLFNKIGVNMTTRSSTVSTSYSDWELYKKRLKEADARIRNSYKN